MPERLSLAYHLNSFLICMMFQCRVRGSQHYLSKGTMSLSREDISLLCEGGLYRKTFSKYTGASSKVDGNFT